MLEETYALLMASVTNKKLGMGKSITNLFFFFLH